MDEPEIEIASYDPLIPTSTWAEVSLSDLLTGAPPSLVPELLQRTDGQPLIYPRRVHSINAEPEAGKTLLALLVCKEVVLQGDHALYLDFEDSSEGIVERLLALQLRPKEIVAGFTTYDPTNR